MPNYDDEEVDETDLSLKEMLHAMLMEVRTVGRRVATFEEKLGNTQDTVESLSTKLETSTEEQGKFWDEARLAASRMDATLAEVKVA